MAEKEHAEVVLIHKAGGIILGCAKCRAVVDQGEWAVGIKIGTHKYVVGYNPPLRHCGEEKKFFIQVRKSEGEARQLADEVREIMNRDGSTSNLNLLEAFPVGSTEIH